MAYVKNLTYTGLEIKEPTLNTLDENDVANELERFRLSQSKEILNTDANYILKNGDLAHMDFCGYLNGEKFEGGEAKGYDLEIGSHSFVPGFEDGMLGMKIGEEKDIPITFPTEYTPELAGKDVIFKVKLIAVKTKEEVALTDELVKNATKMQSIEEFKNAYRAYMAEQFMQEYMAKKHEAMLEVVANANEVEVTAEMVDAQVDSMLNQLEKDLTAYGMTVDQFFAMNGTTKENEIERLREQAKINIKKVIIVEAIMDKENLVVSDEEVDEFLKGKENMPNIDKEGVKTNLSYVKVLEFLDKNNKWIK